MITKWDEIEDIISSNITSNNNNEITGAVLRSVLTGSLGIIKAGIDRNLLSLITANIWDIFLINLFDLNDPDIMYDTALFFDNTTFYLQDCLVTGFIPFVRDMKVLTARVNGVSTINPANNSYIILYDIEKKPLYAYKAASVGNAPKWDENVAYARFSIYDYKKGNILIKAGEADYESYTSYGKPLLNKEAIPSELDIHSKNDYWLQVTTH